MKQVTLIKRIALIVATLVGAAAVFAGGLTLMNMRADWALVLGALLCVAAPILLGVRVWAMIKEDHTR
jgi:hypothetical protein